MNDDIGTATELCLNIMKQRGKQIFMQKEIAKGPIIEKELKRLEVKYKHGLKKIEQNS